MKKIYFVLILTQFGATLKAQVVQNIYSSYSIPKELLKDANAVVRKLDVTYEIKDMTSTTEKEHKIVTVLNEKGKHHAEPGFGYNKLNQIVDIEANFYNSEGKLVKKLKNKDIKDGKNFEEGIDDSRFKIIEFPHLPYPYTVEYTIEKKSKQTMFYPIWQPQSNSSDAVENATLTVIVPENSELRFKEFNLIRKVEKIGNTYKWNMDKIQAFQNESFTPPLIRYIPKVILAPSEFEIAGYKGSMKTWQSLGKFENELNKGRQELPIEVQERIKKLVVDCSDDYCKIEKLYNYMQNSTRYFSIQLGIGGWQPMKASDVEKNKYGDCKALSNYMVSMLAVVGISGRSVTIEADTDLQSLLSDFPNPRFNHVIACVPMKNDTVWLECTSQLNTCGYLNYGTVNRMVLIDDPEGGKIAYTPNYNEIINVESRTVNILLNTEGGATVSSKTQYKGLTQDYYLQMEQANEDLRKKVMYERLKINNFEIKEMRFDKIKKPKPYVEENLTLDVKSLASLSGKRLFLPFNLFSKWEKTPSLDSTRLFEVQADSRGFTEDETINIALPEGYSLESKTGPLSIESVFGSFELKINVEDKKLTINRKLVVNNKVQPKESFAKLVEFFKAVAKADKTKLVLVKTI
jgi:Domain of Unknown Function with PDB structure (DUF3857)